MDSPATYAVVTMITQLCVDSERKPSMHLMTLEALEKADHPGTPSPSTMADIPVSPLTGSHTTPHPAIASPMALPTVHPPSV